MLQKIDIFQLTYIKISPNCWQNISNSKINSNFPMYLLYSANNYAVFVYHFTCKTVFVPLGEKNFRAWFAAPTFSRSPICRARFARGPICRKKSPFATYRQGQNLYWLESNWNMCSWWNRNGIGKQVGILFLWYEIIQLQLLLCLPSKSSCRDLNSGMLWDPVTRTKFPLSLLVSIWFWLI